MTQNVSVTSRGTLLARFKLCVVPQRTHFGADACCSQRMCGARNWNLLVAAVLMMWGSVCSYCCGAPSGVAQAATVRASVDSNGVQGNEFSVNPSLSADGSKVAFLSFASNLILGDTNVTFDVFVRDLTTGVTTRVSLDSNGVQGNGAAGNLSLSADGNKVAFSSEASNLVAGDTNNTADIFVRDLTTGVTTRVSVDSSGNQGNGSCSNPTLSADGNKVAFESNASNLVTGDTNNNADIFVRDLTSGVTTRVSVDSSGNQSDNLSYNPSLSADGSKVAFESLGSNLVSGDTNGTFDVFVRDLTSGVTTRVSVDPGGNQSDGFSTDPSLSADGSKVAFESNATDLVSGDTNGTFDVFVRDLTTSITTRVSLNSNGNQGNGFSIDPSLSANGSKVAFASEASSLVAGDTNGKRDIFVRDLTSGVTTRVSVDSSGNQSDDVSYTLTLSADGSKAAFDSVATNLVLGDTNGKNDIFVSDTVLVPNEAPSISDIANQTTPEDTPLTVNFFISDAETSPANLNVTAISDNQALLPNANLTLGGSGANRTLSLTPAANLSGSATITVTVSDGALSASDTFVLSVTAVNDAPVTSAQSVSTSEDTALNITLSASDVDTPLANLTYRITTRPTHGILSGSAANLIYTPEANYNGADSFAFVANDGALDSVPATISLQVLAVNDAPIADAQTLSTRFGTALNLTLSGSDIDTPVTNLAFSLVTVPAHGTLSGSAPNLTYTPAANFSGADAFTFKINDGQADSNVATIALQVLASEALPIADAQSVETDEDTPLAIVLSGSEANATYGIVTQPAHGTLSGTAPNLTYTPAANYNGSDAFTFQLTNANGQSNIATVSISVRPGDDPPIAVDDAYTLIYGPSDQVQQTGVILQTTGVFLMSAPGVLANDRNPSGGDVKARLARNPSHGRVLLRADGTLYYAPNSGFVGVDELIYFLDNGQGRATARVRLTVIDKRAPELRFDTPRDRATVKTIGEIKGRARDRNSGLKMLTLQWKRFDGAYWNGSAWTGRATELPLKINGINWIYEGKLPAPGTDPTKSLLDGRYDLRATATDNSGNLNQTTNRVIVANNTPAAPEVSSVRLSSATAAQNSVVVNFTGALDATVASNTANYRLSVNGAVGTVATAAYANNAVTLSGFAFKADDKVTLQIGDLRDATGKTLKGGTLQLIAR